MVLGLAILTVVWVRAALNVHRLARVRGRLGRGSEAALRPTTGVAGLIASVLGRPDATRDRAVPEWLEGVARAVRGGSSIPQAVVDTGPPDGLTADVEALRRQLRHGAPTPEVFAAWRATASTHSVRLGAAALELAAQGGGAMARALDAVAASLRERQAIQDEVRALSAQARASAAVIAGLPLAFALLAAATEPAVLTFLVTTWIGAICLGLGLALETVGGLWMRRITKATPW